MVVAPEVAARLASSRTLCRTASRSTTTSARGALCSAITLTMLPHCLLRLWRPLPGPVSGPHRRLGFPHPGGLSTDHSMARFHPHHPDKLDRKSTRLNSSHTDI